MRILAVLKIISALIMVYFWTSKVNAQEQIGTLSQDPKFEQLLNEKRKITIGLKDYNKVEIINGITEKDELVKPE